MRTKAVKPGIPEDRQGIKVVPENQRSERRRKIGFVFSPLFCRIRKQIQREGSKKAILSEMNRSMGIGSNPRARIRCVAPSQQVQAAMLSRKSKHDTNPSGKKSLTRHGRLERTDMKAEETEGEKAD